MKSLRVCGRILEARGSMGVVYAYGKRIQKEPSDITRSTHEKLLPIPNLTVVITFPDHR